MERKSIPMEEIWHTQRGSLEIIFPTARMSEERPKTKYYPHGTKRKNKEEDAIFVGHMEK